MLSECQLSLAFYVVTLHVQEGKQIISKGATLNSQQHCVASSDR